MTFASGYAAMSSGAKAQAGKSQTAWRRRSIRVLDDEQQETNLAMPKKLVPFRLCKGLSTEVLSLNGVAPHVTVSRVDHGIHHAEVKKLAVERWSA